MAYMLVLVVVLSLLTVIVLSRRYEYIRLKTPIVQIECKKGKRSGKKKKN